MLAASELQDQMEGRTHRIPGNLVPQALPGPPAGSVRWHYKPAWSQDHFPWKSMGRLGLDPVILPEGDVVSHRPDHSAQTVSLVPSFPQAAFPACPLGRWGHLLLPPWRDRVRGKARRPWHQ